MAGETAVKRRNFVAGVAALSAFAVSRLSITTTVAAQAQPRRIDVHHHISPPTWLDAVQKAKFDVPPMVTWSLQKSLDDMDKAGVATAITSPTMPQVGFLGKEQAARIARESNEFATKLMIDHPGRFGIFAMLPLPHIDESLKEIDYAFNALNVDGIGMMTSYGDTWLGYPQFTPVFEELNRRKATVYTHPNRPNCCVNVVQGDSALGDRVRRRHDAHDREPDLQRHVAAREARQLHFLPRRRCTDGGRRALRGNGPHTGIQGPVHQPERGSGAQTLLL